MLLIFFKVKSNNLKVSSLPFANLLAGGTTIKSGPKVSPGVIQRSVKSLAKPVAEFQFTLAVQGKVKLCDGLNVPTFIVHLG